MIHTPLKTDLCFHNFEILIVNIKICVEGKPHPFLGGTERTILPKPNANGGTVAGWYPHLPTAGPEC